MNDNGGQHVLGNKKCNMSQKGERTNNKRECSSRDQLEGFGDSGIRRSGRVMEENETINGRIANKGKKFIGNFEICEGKRLGGIGKEKRLESYYHNDKYAGGGWGWGVSSEKIEELDAQEIPGRSMGIQKEETYKKYGDDAGKLKLDR